MSVVRKALVTDWQDIAILLRAFRSDPVTPFLFAGEDEHPQAERFLVGTLAQNTSFIAHIEDKAIGMFLSIKNNIPFTNNIVIEELAWYVLQEHRHGKSGLMLLNYWESEVRLQKEEGAIIAGIMHTMAASPIDLIKRGYVVSDTTYIL